MGRKMRELGPEAIKTSFRCFYLSRVKNAHCFDVKCHYLSLDQKITKKCRRLVLTSEVVILIHQTKMPNAQGND